MSQYDRMVASQKEFLPKKAIRKDQPNFLWIIPPIQNDIRSKDNKLRIEFGKALSTAANLHDNTCARNEEAMGPRRPTSLQ